MSELVRLQVVSRSWHDDHTIQDSCEYKRNRVRSQSERLKRQSRSTGTSCASATKKLFNSCMRLMLPKGSTQSGGSLLQSGLAGVCGFLPGHVPEVPGLGASPL